MFEFCKRIPIFCYQQNKCNLHWPTKIWCITNITLFCAFFPPRTVISISLAKTRSSSGPVRWLTWRNCALTSCAWLVSTSRRQSAAGWPAKSTSGWENPPSPFRDMYEVTRHAGTWTLKNSRIMWLEAIENVNFFFCQLCQVSAKNQSSHCHSA